jgi:hypothetical protein
MNRLEFLPRVAALCAVALSVASASADVVSTAFTYQGRLNQNGQPATGQYDLWFRLYTGADSIFTVGSPIALENVPVEDGLFTVTLDFGAAFDGNERWLSVGVRPGVQVGAYTMLSPRQELAATPHAVVAKKFAVPMFVGGDTDPDIFGPNAIMNITQTGSAAAVRGTSAGVGAGVYGEATNGGIGVLGETNGAGPAVSGVHNAATGFRSAVYGESHSNSGRGVEGHNVSTAGGAAFGVQGMTESSTSGAAGVRGVANGGGTAATYGVRGETTSTGGTGVYGLGGKYGVYGLSMDGGIDSVGVLAISSEPDGVGVTGRASGGTGVCTGVLGQAPNGGWAGFFEGDVRVAGLVWANEKDFLIDNPANPEQEYLFHACIESDERRNLYDGVVILDDSGSASVDLPQWFDKLNARYAYQLTCVGGYAPVYVASEIAENHFTIAGGTPGLKVSWQVTGVRIDPDAASRPFVAVRPKGEGERGRFVNATAHGRSTEQQIRRIPNPWRVGGPTGETPLPVESVERE